MHHQQQYQQASEPTEGAPGHAPPPPAAASAGAVAAGGPMALLSSATEPEPLLKPGSGDPLREEEELDADVAAKLDAAATSAFGALTGVLERCLLLTGARR